MKNATLTATAFVALLIPALASAQGRPQNGAPANTPATKPLNGVYLPKTPVPTKPLNGEYAPKAPGATKPLNGEYAPPGALEAKRPLNGEYAPPGAPGATKPLNGEYAPPGAPGATKPLNGEYAPPGAPRATKPLNGEYAPMGGAPPTAIRVVGPTGKIFQRDPETGALYYEGRVVDMKTMKADKLKSRDLPPIPARVAPQS